MAGNTLFTFSCTHASGSLLSPRSKRTSCLGLIRGVGTFSVPFCPECHHDDDNLRLAMVSADAADKAFAALNMASMLSRIHHLARIPFELLREK